MLHTVNCYIAILRPSKVKVSKPQKAEGQHVIIIDKTLKLRPSRYQLRSSQSNQLIVPPVKLSTYGPRSFAVAGPTAWNNLPVYLRDPELSLDNFRRQLKRFLFAQY